MNLWSRIRLSIGLFLSLLVLTGCPPEFEDGTCSTDEDCFAGEVCNTTTNSCQIAAVDIEPEILSLSATPNPAPPNSQVTVEWSTEQALSGRISDESDDLETYGGSELENGSYTFTIGTEAKTLTLTARNGENTVSESVQIDIDPPDLAITDFQANPNPVEPEGLLTLTWATQNAESARIIAPDEEYMVPVTDIEGGQWQTTLTQTSTFTLEVTSIVGEVVSQELEVVVEGGEPVVNTFTATPAAIVVGDSVDLAWDTTGADAIEITDDLGGAVSTAGEAPTGGSVSVSPTEDRDYTLTASNAFGDTEATASVTVEEALSIDSFNAGQMQITDGDSVMLGWTVSGTSPTLTLEDDSGTNIDISGQPTASGAIAVSPSQTTTYTLSAETPLQSDSATVTVTVVPPAPVINSFSANPTQVATGGTSTLAWDITGATSITLTNDLGTTIPTAGKAVTTDSVAVNLTSTRTFTLRADNAGGFAEATVTVVAGDAVAITSFQASPPSIAPGQSVTLSWTTANATVLDLETNQGDVIDLTGTAIAADSVTVSPAMTTTYTLTADGIGGPVTFDVTVTVQPAVSITSFSASPTTVVNGDSVTLTWATSDASSIQITYVDSGGTTQLVNTVGKMVVGDSVTVTPTADTTYTLTVDGFQGPVTDSASVTVQDPVSITAFTVGTDPIAPGDSTTLTWSVANATSVSIADSGGTAVDLTGTTTAGDSVSVSPTSTETYTLTANGPGGPVTADVTVTVQPAVAITSFTASPTTSLTGDPVTLTWATTDASGIAITYVDGGGTTQTVDTTSATIDGDSVVVNPTESTTYTLTATGFQGPVTATASVTVQDPVAITSFTTDYSAVAPGEAAALTWAVANATSVAITDSGGAAVDLTGTTTAGDTVSVTPSASETYTLTANGPGGPVTSQVSVDVIDPDGITISEILADPTNANDLRQWVEITNTGSTILDLSNFSLGAGSGAYDEALVQLAGSLAPGDCAVVGGPTSDVDNGSPAYDVSSDFNPDLPALGGVALFVGPTAEQNSTRTPVASVVWGGSNGNGLLDDDGTVKTEISPALVEGSSLTRTSGSDAFVQASPTPGQCFHIVSVSPSVGSNQASGTVSVAGFGFDTALDTFDMGTDALTGCVATAGGVDCTLPTSSQTGFVDLSVSRVNEFVSDGSGGTTIQSRSAPIVGTFTDAYTYEDEFPDPGASYYCGISAVAPGDTVAIGTDVTVTLEVYLAGETDVNGTLPAGYVVEALEFAGGVHPATIFDAGWGSTTAGAPSGNNATFSATFNNATATTSEIAFRVSPNSGLSWYYCDTNASSGSDDGYQVGGGQSVTWQ